VGGGVGGPRRGAARQAGHDRAAGRVRQGREGGIEVGLHAGSMVG
jgi:hypothetical protein